MEKKPKTKKKTIQTSKKTKSIDVKVDDKINTEMNHHQQLDDLIKSENIDPTIAMNILINAVQVSYDKSHFNALDRLLISKAINCFKHKIESGENFTIKVK